MNWGFGELRDYSWSESEMNIQEVQQLLRAVVAALVTLLVLR